ncbi:TSUP family transporter [Enterovibrio sp. ZSDZ42]|uniref:Probable membrane transporter protein n=1 Tax=Enterovibrio gelatinilyticus TaxID=2899819 RepID=A0ABT5R6F8_9GAMM|nr:TSUP family transporter [Enterovibrio sp. ZSDZ42]MDD1795087.1 TSUP family transporter [Enterovibrio sp. ZSDZ42]
MELANEILFFLFVTAIVAGCIDALAGGGGLITIPAMLMCGIPPVSAIATNKVGGVGGTLSASLHFIKTGDIQLSEIKWMMLTTFLGAFFGGMVLTMVDSDFLSLIVPFLLIGFSLYFLFSPNLGDVDQEKKISPYAYTLVVATAIGFYDGFFGPGTGSFFAISLVFLLGFNLVKATAQTKILNFCSNLAALLYFIYEGSIIWDVGLLMFIGLVIGGKVGAKLVLSKGKQLIKFAMIVVTIGISTKMLILD